jgi:hypothetical protein
MPVVVYETSRSNDNCQSSKASFSQHHPAQSEEERPPLQQEQTEQRTKRKREMNVIHSRRKRERQKIEVEVLRKRCSELSAKNLFLFYSNKSLDGLLTKANSIVSKSLVIGDDESNTLFSSCDDISCDLLPAEAPSSTAATHTPTSLQELRRLPSSLSSLPSIPMEAVAGGLLPTGNRPPPLLRTSVPMLPSVSNRVTGGRSASLYHLLQQQQHRQQQQQQEQQQQQQGWGNNHFNLQTTCTLQHQQQQLHPQQQQQQQQQQQSDHQVQLVMPRRAAASSGISLSDLLVEESLPNTTATNASATRGGPLFGGATGRLAGNMLDLPTLLQLQILLRHQEQQHQE